MPALQKIVARANSDKEAEYNKIYNILTCAKYILLLHVKRTVLFACAALNN
jgi:hypothetical protein